MSVGLDVSVGLVVSDGSDVDGAGESVEGHTGGVIPLSGSGAWSPVTVTQASGEDGDSDGDVEAEVDGDSCGDFECEGGGGGDGAGLSCLPWSPCFRANQSSSS
ncbi:hypothetical protein [Streptomyces narbonensis]